MEILQPEIEIVSEVYSQSEVAELLTPTVNSWIEDSFEELNQVQRMAIPRIIENKNTLVMAPTGAGKTLAAFMGIISELHRLEEEDQLEEQIYALYVSPLKALNNDIHKNLEIPLEEIKQRSGSTITAAKRTGDTPTKERQRMVRKPPHILITTPESLGLMLVASKMKQRLRNIRWLIIDEIHSIADNKRGTHLSLSLERLEHYLERPLTRIGLSATVEPAETVGNYLVGSRNTHLGIIDRGGIRELDIEVITPTRNLVHAPFSMIEKQQLEYLQQYLSENRTILVFTNTRHMSERLSIELAEQVEEDFQDKIAVHHGSLDKEVRLQVENRLKQGEMKAVFTSTSLEMGIDIGSIDLTVQLGSPKTVRALLQRIGRSGHSQNLVSKGRVLVFSRDDLLECVAIAKLAQEGRIDAIRIPNSPSDVLIQIIVGMAVEKKWDFTEAYQVIKHAYPYRELKYPDFLHVLRTAADPTKNEDSWKYGHIWIDEEIEEFGRRKSARQSYLQNIGTIPDSTTIDVVLQGFRTTIGQIAEKFAERLQEDDIFVLGGKSYEFIRSVGNKIIVENAPGRVPTVPSWGGEAQTRTYEISKEMDYLLSQVESHLQTSRAAAVDWVEREYPVGPAEAEAIVDYIIEQLGMAQLPQLDRIVVESYTDPAGSTNILALMLFGLETNQALAQALGRILSDKLQHNIGVLATDNGILLKIPPGMEVDYSTIFQELTQVDLTEYVMKSLRDTEMFKVRFRHAAARALMILRRWGRKSISVSQQQRTAYWLLRHLDEDMEIIKETYREILYDTYNLEQAQQVVNGIATGDIVVNVEEPSEVPSSFTHDILLNGELDVVMMEDRRNLLASLHQQVVSRILPELAEYETILDPQEVREYFAEKFSDRLSIEKRLVQWAEFPYPEGVDTIDEATKLLGIEEKKLIELIAEQEGIVSYNQERYTTWDQLAFIAATQGEEFWKQFDQSSEQFSESSEMQQIYQRAKEISPSVGWEVLLLKALEFGGPQTEDQLLERLNTSMDKINPVLKRLQRRNTILRGSFTSDEKQYLRAEDREHLNQISKPSEIITEEQLKNYRLYKMRLLRSNRSERMTIIDYLRENGPARDPVELLSRLESFDWRKLRALLTSRDVYFGRFLGKRLVFIHHQDLEALVQVTRDTSTALSEISQLILETLSERPGLTQRELSLLLNYPSSTISDGIKQLEEQLYISRTGFELTLSHGGFPNPRYIPLPFVQTNEERYKQAVQYIIERCCHWYGPLTLNDLLRVTRLPYPVVEHALQQSDLIKRKILNATYYGHEYSYDQLDNFEVNPEELDQVYLLSPLDPYFYMTSGSFRRDFLPRQTRLSIIHEGMPKGYVEMSIPDKDILQVINLQISKRRLRNFDFVKKVAINIRDLAKRAYQTPVVFIEEINFKAANHPDNSLVVTTLKEVGYFLHIDHLVTGTAQKHEFDRNDVFATRQITKNQLENQSYTELSKLIRDHPMLTHDQAVAMIKSKPSKAQLLISHHLRSGDIHYRNGKIYRDDLFRVLFGRTDTSDLPVFLELTQDLSRNELAKRLELPENEVADQLYELVRNGYVELITPFAKTNEYRRIPEKEMSLGKQIKILLTHVITTRGPLSFGELLEEASEHLDITRTQVLLILTQLLKDHTISSAAIRDSQGKSREIMYFTPEQAEILGDPGKDRYFEGWNIYAKEEKIFEFDNSDSHILVYQGQPVASFEYNRDNDRGIIDDINFINSQLEEIDLMDMVAQLEDFVFTKGMKQIEIAKIAGAIPKYWMDLQ